MGKGYNNYMCKKFFHPSSKDNQKRLWQAQKKHEGDLQAQAELRAQYDKEQELYQNKALLSKESKDKLEVNFMYEPPPGMKKVNATHEEDENGEPEFKFEWQRTWGSAPKEAYLGEGDNFAEQPFGIQVCQAKCMKCGAFGHMNIDKRCPMYGKAVDADAPMVGRDSDKLISEMRQEGMAMRWSSWDMGSSAPVGAQCKEKKMEMVDSYEQPKALVDRAAVLKNMSKEDKKKLLKKLEKMEKKKKEKKKRRNDTSDDDSSSDDEKRVKVKREPESRRGEMKREPESRRGEREMKREPESRRGEMKREPESSRRRSRSRDRRDRSRSTERRDRSRSRSRDRTERRSRSRSTERRDRRDRR